MIFFPSAQKRELARWLTDRHKIVVPKALDLNEFPQMRDIKDFPILAIVIMGDIDIFVTGDKDFLVLLPYLLWSVARAVTG